MEERSDTVTLSDDDYTSINYNRASGTFENVNYETNTYELTSINNNQTVASAWSTDVTNNPAYVRRGKKDAAHSLGSTNYPTKNQISSHKVFGIVTVLSIIALLISIGALLCAVLSPMIYNNEANQSEMQRNSCIATNSQQINCTGYQQQLQCLEAVIEQLEDRVNELRTQINAPVNLYESCFEETQFCYLRPAIGLYWRQCATGELPMNIPEHYTQSMRCEHRSRRFGIFQESAYLRPDDTNQNVRCVCDTTYPNPDVPGHFVIPDDEDADLFCQMVIVRCPLATILFNKTV